MLVQKAMGLDLKRLKLNPKKINCWYISVYLEFLKARTDLSMFCKYSIVIFQGRKFHLFILHKLIQPM